MTGPRKRKHKCKDCNTSLSHYRRGNPKDGVWRCRSCSARRNIGKINESIAVTKVIFLNLQTLRIIWRTKMTGQGPHGRRLFKTKSACKEGKSKGLACSKVKGGYVRRRVEK